MTRCHVRFNRVEIRVKGPAYGPGLSHMLSVCGAQGVAACDGGGARPPHTWEGGSMATSRTGTARWKNVRARALTKAQREGITHCPICRVPLDYTQGRHPNSAEPDHVIEEARGGSDMLDNLRIICRRCNQRRGGRLGAKRTPRPTRHRKQQPQSVVLDHSAW